MSYVKQNFEKGQILKADHLNHMEDGIAQLASEVETPKDGTQIDDTTVGLDAWSSKHIVDMICPPLDETGNLVQCYPVAGYPLDCKVNWEPTQEGSGDPSPDNIRPIKGRDSVTVERCGENLLDIEQCRPVAHGAAYGLTVTVDDTGLIKLSGIPTVTAGGSRRFRVLFTDQVILTKEYKAKAFIVKGAVDSITGILADKSIVMIAPLTPNTSVEVQFRLMYYTGDEPTTYAPYTGQTATLTLPETVYGGEIDAVSGDGIKNWKRVVFDGTERWNVRTANYISYSFPLPMRSNTGFCTHFKNILYGAIRPDTGTGETGCYLEFSSSAIFNVPFENVADWKNYLAAQYAAGTPVCIVYQYANEVNEPITATGAQPIPALSGVNTVLTDADSVTVTGRADPIKRITDLEDAVASITNT